MKKTTMNVTKRTLLGSYARKVIVFPEQQEAERVAFFALRVKLFRALRKVCTPSDLKVLRKFRATRQSMSFTFPGKVEFGYKLRDISATPKGRYEYHNHSKEDLDEWALEMPSGWGVTFALDDERYVGLLPLVDAWQEARNDHTALRATALLDLTCLFRNSKYLEDVIKAWPPAKDIAVSLGLVPPLDDATRARLKALQTKASVEGVS